MTATIMATMLGSKRYSAFDAWCKKHVALIQVFMGAVVLALATFVAVIAILVFAQQHREHEQHHKEAVTVRIACERSQHFGPALVDFLVGAEAKLQVGALLRPINIDGHDESVIEFYRSTIPTKCP